MSFTHVSLVEAFFISCCEARTDDPGRFLFSKSPDHNDEPPADLANGYKALLVFRMLFVEDLKIIIGSKKAFRFLK